MTPYSLQAVKKGRRGGAAESDLAGEEMDTQEAEEEEEEGVSTDAMIKVRTLGLQMTMWVLF